MFSGAEVGLRLQVPATIIRQGIRYRVERKKNGGNPLLIMKKAKAQLLQVKDTEAGQTFMMSLLCRLRDDKIADEDLKPLKDAWMQEPSKAHAVM